MKAKIVMFLILGIPSWVFAQSLPTRWRGYAHDAQHTAISSNASQPLNKVHWSTPVDTTSPSGPIFIHYGSPMVTAENTVLVPVKTQNGSAAAFQIKAFAAGVSGPSPTPLYTLTTDYSLPPHNWTPSYGPTLSEHPRIYYAGAGGTVYYRDQVNLATGSNGKPGATGQIAFYGNLSVYTGNRAAFDSGVQISTPLVSDRNGNIYFGFVVTGNPASLNLVSGVARISASGVGSWVSARAASGGDSLITQVPLNCTPVLANDELRLYFAVSTGSIGSDGGRGYLVSVDSTTLAPIAHVALLDPSNSNPASIYSDSSASPTVGPDGDVYYGVLENPCCFSHNDRGWMLHFNFALTEEKIPGSFGWDSTAAIVPSRLVPSYTGTSSYLILTKYNNYVDIGTGNGDNKVAVVDPNASMPDPIKSSVNVMKEVITVAGIGTPPVAEWCINSGAIDPLTKAAIINSEDGHVYRWDFASNSLTQQVDLNPPTSEAYTSTVIGPDGTIYAINDAVLYALGQ